MDSTELQHVPLYVHLFIGQLSRSVLLRPDIPLSAEGWEREGHISLLVPLVLSGMVVARQTSRMVNTLCHVFVNHVGSAIS